MTEVSSTSPAELNCSNMSTTSPSPRASSAHRNSGPALGSNPGNNDSSISTRKEVLSGRGKSSANRPSGGKFRGNQGPNPSPQSNTHRQVKNHQKNHPNKRPQARVSLNSSSSDGAEGYVADADEFEIGSVYNAGSKKQNISHLLNFQFERRGTNGNQPLTGAVRRHKASSVPYRPKYRKEQYLQANCQFVVKSGIDLSAHMNDPDTLVDWELIEQVNLKTSGVPSCPICLYPPTAAKITRCGHVFCWSCILHYLALSDDDYRKCPICYDSIYKDDLKSVVSLLHSELQTGGMIEMQLMRRERHSLFAVPVGQYYPEIEKRHPSIKTKNNSYSKLLVATPMQVISSVISREIAELRAQYSDEKDEPEACFIEEALRTLDKRQTLLLLSKFNQKPDIPPPVPENKTVAPQQAQKKLIVTPPQCEVAIASSPDQDRPRHMSASSDDSSSIDVTEDDDLFNDYTISAEDLDFGNADGKKATCNTPKDTFFFYQSSDGQAIFLHSLNVQMLVQEYGSLDKCPPFISGRILEKDSAVMTEEMRNRLRYLRHVPITCNFEVCEISLKSPMVSKETIALFQDQLDQRRLRRNKRARNERRREKKIKLEENKIMGKYPETSVSFESSVDFPEMSQTNLRHSSESLASSPSAQFTDMVDHASPACSFANKLKAVVAKPNPWGVMRKSETVPVLRQRQHSDSEPEPEGYVPPPPQASIGDALALAIERASLQESSGKKNGKKGKKSKGTKIVLTGGARPAI